MQYSSQHRGKCGCVQHSPGGFRQAPGGFQQPQVGSNTPRGNQHAPGGFQHNLECSSQRRGLIDTDDWTRATLPSWNESILEGFRRPSAVLRLGPPALLQGLRETPTMMLMRWAFARGMMQFGVFRLAAD